MNECWQAVPFREILAKSEDWIDVKPDRTYKQVTVRMWGQGVVQRGEVSGMEIAAKRMLVVHPQQFIVSRIDARHGASGLIPDFLDGAVVTNDFPVFTPDTTRIFPKFLGWMTKTNDFIDLCKSASEGTTNRVRLKEERFLAMEISLPSLDEQRRIVARIEELVAKVEEARGLRSKTLTEIEALSKSAMRQFFSSDSGYQSVSLESVCSAIIDNLHSNPVYSDHGVPCVRSCDVAWGTLLLETARRTDEEEYKRRTVRGEPSVDDVVLVREGGGTGKAAIVKEGERFSLGQRVMMLRPNKDKVLPKFFLYQILSPFIQEEQILLKTTGSASPHLNIGDLKKFSFLCPSLEQQNCIVGYLDNLQVQVESLKNLQTQTAAELDALLPSILDRAFKGEL